MLVGVPTALGVVLALRVNLQMIRQLKAITQLFEQIDMGDYAARAAVLSEDELERHSQLAQSYARSYADAHTVPGRL